MIFILINQFFQNQFETLKTSSMNVRHNFKLGLLAGTLSLLMILNKIYDTPQAPPGNSKSDQKK